MGDLGSIPGLGRSLERNGNPLQYSRLQNSMDGGAWWATVHGIAKSRTRLSDFTSLPHWQVGSLPLAAPAKPCACPKELKFQWEFSLPPLGSHYILLSLLFTIDPTLPSIGILWIPLISFDLRAENVSLYLLHL